MLSCVTDVCFSCGPTVYNHAHIGNFRAFLANDILKRWLLYCGYDVEHVCNLTDVDDKIISRMATKKISLRELTDKYAQAFFDGLKVKLTSTLPFGLTCMQMLNILPASAYPRATAYVPQMVHMVQHLMSTGHAYQQNGSVYFKVSSCADYGRLSGKGVPEVAADTAIGEGKLQADQRDFALWKAHSEKDGEVFWDSPMGRGRPGWHIECSAMAHSLLGDCIDIHSGGADLIFPHHVNEIAQTEAFTGRKPFSRYWLHNGFVNINDQKMSKSAGGFLTLKDVIQKPADARAFRLMMISVQYRSPLNFNADSMQAARNTLRRIDRACQRLSSLAADYDGEAEMYSSITASLMDEFESAMADDLNTPMAVAAFLKVIKLADRISTASAANKAIEVLKAMDNVLGLFYEVPMADGCTGDAAPSISTVNVEDVQEMAEHRRKLKANKQFAEADEVRKRIKELGFDVQDTKDGFVLVPVS